MRWCCQIDGRAWGLTISVAVSLFCGCRETPTTEPDAKLEELGGAIRRDAEGNPITLHFRVKVRVDDEALRQVGELRHLTELDLDRTPITDKGLAFLQRLDKLRRLGLRGTRITSDGLKQLEALSALEELQLASCGKVTDAAIPTLKRFVKLRRLGVHGTGLTPAGIESLRAALPDCEVY